MRTLCLCLVLISTQVCGLKIEHRMKKLGDLVALTTKHPLNGSVYYRVDEPSVISVSNFNFPVLAPDAFFWAGEDMTGGGCNDDVVGPTSYYLIPGEVGNTDYYNTDQPLLGVFDGTQKDIILRLPDGVTVRDIKWFCCWCREFSVNFAEFMVNE